MPNYGISNSGRVKFDTRHVECNVKLNQSDKIFFLLSLLFRQIFSRFRKKFRLVKKAGVNSVAQNI